MPHAHSPILTLLVQVGLILALSRVMGWLFGRVRQPQVVGEMVAGILLGPTFLGQFPSISQTLFPPESIDELNLLSQLGVIIFLFLVGLEFDPNLVRSRGRAAAAISVTSIAAPFAIGIGLTYALYPRLFNDPTRDRFFAASLFMGAAVSVTAFPVLARMLTERNLHKTPVGALSIAGAAVDDVSAWCMLALVTAVAQHKPGAGPTDALLTLAMAAAYVLFVVFAVRPVLQRLRAYYDRRGELSPNLMAAILLLVLASAYTTEQIGIHALFGAFLMGCVMPKSSSFVHDVRLKIEDFTVVFLLPIFFAYAGLRADITKIFSGNLWGYAILVVLGACVGKIGGAALAARVGGQRWRESMAVGVLMNTRGLMELIILTAGLSLGVINQNVYSIMVIMALVTTAMTSPLLELVYPARLFGADEARAKRTAGNGGFSLLVPVALPESGPALARVAKMMLGDDAAAGKIFALHLRRAADRDSAGRSILEEQTAEAADDPVLQPLLNEAREQRVPADAISFVTRDVAADIAAVAEGRKADLVLIGFHKPVIGATILGGTVHRVLTQTPADVGILVDRGLDSRPIQRILVPFLGSPHDRKAMDLAGRTARNTNASVTVLHVVSPKRGDVFGPTSQPLDARKTVEKVFSDPSQPAPVTFRVIEDDSPVDAVLREAAGYDLVVIGVAEQWGLESHLLSFRRERIASECPTSLLIVRSISAGHS